MKKILFEIFDKMIKEFLNQNWWPGDTQDEIIIGAVLTQNTSWKNVEKSIKRLKNAGLLSLEKIKNTSQSELENLIRQSGFYKSKSLYLKEIAKNIYRSKINKNDITEAKRHLLSIKGVGKETADSILLYAFEKPVFVVDAYTKRIFARIGLIEKSAKYDEIQKFFMDNLPSEAKLFNEYHALIVKLGKNFCSKKNPKCHDCPLQKLCKYAKIKHKKENS